MQVVMNAEIQTGRLIQPAKVTLTQWLLSIAMVLLALYSYSLSSTDELATLGVLLAGLNSVLMIQAAREALQNGPVGKLLLTASVVFFFWTDAVALSLDNPPFAVPARLPILSGQFQPELVQQGYFYVTIFQVMLLIGYSVRPRLARARAWIRSRVDATSRSTQIFKYGLAACALLPLFMTYGFSVEVTIDALLASRGGAVERQEIGLLHYLYFFGMYGAAFFLAEALVYRDWRQTFSRARSLVLGLIASVPFIMLWGTRHLWLFVALPACILLVSHRAGKLKLGTALKWGAMILILLAVAQLQLALRLRGWTEIGTVSSEEVFSPSSGQFTALLFAENLVPDIHDYFLELAEPYFLIHWIPRVFWPEKPIMESWEYYNDAYVRGGAYNVTPSIIGQLHINFGVFGVIFIGIWMGFLTWLADQALATIDFQGQRAMGTAIGVFFAFIVSSFRFYSPIYFTYAAFGLVAMFFLTTRAASEPIPATGTRDMTRPLLAHRSGIETHARQA